MFTSAVDKQNEQDASLLKLIQEEEKSSTFGFVKDELLYVAAYYGYTKTAEYLLGRDADCNQIAVYNAMANIYQKIATPAFCKKAGVEIPKGNLDFIHYGKYSALAIAVLRENFAIAETMITKNKGNINIKCTTSNFPLLYIVVEKNHLSAVQFLIKHHVDVHATDSYGNTALHRAACYEFEDCAKLLIEAEANPIQQAEKNGKRTPLDFAKEKNNQTLISLFTTPTKHSKPISPLRKNSLIKPLAEEKTVKATETPTPPQNTSNSASAV